MKAVLGKLAAEDKGELLVQKWLFLSKAFFIVKFKFQNSYKTLSQIFIDNFLIQINFRLLAPELQMSSSARSAQQICNSG